MSVVVLVVVSEVEVISQVTEERVERFTDPVHVVSATPQCVFDFQRGISCGQDDKPNRVDTGEVGNTWVAQLSANNHSAFHASHEPRIQFVVDDVQIVRPATQHHFFA